MPAERTLVTELATALGTLDCPDLPTALRSRPAALRVDVPTWDRLDRLYHGHDYSDDFAVAFDNGRAFALADDGLAGRPPRIIEWTGGRRAPVDDSAPIDLRIDHVYLVSCKYLSANIANVAPSRLFEGLLSAEGRPTTDWYEATAPAEYQGLYEACVDASGLADLPARVTELSTADRKRLRPLLEGRRYPVTAQRAYTMFCEAVSRRSAELWGTRLQTSRPESMVWRLLRISSAPYFVLGAHRSSSVRLRVGTPWDWQHAYTLSSFDVAPAGRGQPQVDWHVEYHPRASRTRHVLDGHVEIRWSHGRFQQAPEAKVYLDTPIDQVPGYHQLISGPHRLPGL